MNKILQSEGLYVDVFDEINPEPDLKTATEVAAFARNGKYDLVVGMVEAAS